MFVDAVFDRDDFARAGALTLLGNPMVLAVLL